MISTEIWRVILLKLEPPDIDKLCIINPSLKPIRNNEGFYRDYFYTRGRMPPISMEQYYNDWYYYIPQAKSLITYLKYEYDYTNRAWWCGITVRAPDVWEKIDISLFEDLVTNAQMKDYLREWFRIVSNDKDENEFPMICIKIMSLLNPTYQIRFFAEIGKPCTEGRRFFIYSIRTTNYGPAIKTCF